MLRLLAVLVASAFGAVRAHPIEGVITLLDELSEKSIAQGKAEELSYVKFEYWCKNSKKTLSDAITKEKTDIDALQNEIAGKEKQQGVLTKQIAALEKELGELDAAGTAAKAQRGEEAALFKAADQDYTDTIKAIDDAIVALGGAKTATTGLAVAQQRVRKVAYLALTTVVATEEQRKALQEFMGEGRPDLEAEGDHGAHVKKYSFKSDSVIELLKNLKMKFEDEKLAATKAETNSLNAFSLSTDALQNAITAAETSKDSKTSELSSVEGDLATAANNLGEVQGDLEADSSLLDTTDKQCAVKESEWADRSAARKGELAAIEAAVGILAKVTGVRTEAPKNPGAPASPLDAPAAFLQVPAADPKQRAVQLLREEARETHSRALYRLAQEISVHGPGPFNEVNNMIQKMIQRLMSEQTDEDNHKNWCDAEMTKSDVSKTSKTEKHAELTAAIDVGTATAQLRTTELEENAKMLEDIASHMTEATEIRQTGKSENKAATKDSQEAQVAVTNAITVLVAYYKDSGMMKKEAWEFVQRGVDLPANPETWDSSFTGVSDPTEQPGGIVTVLKKVSADFAIMEAETKAQEETDQSEYEEEKKRCAIEKARRSKESDMKTNERGRLLDKVSSLTKSAKHTSSELDAVKQYLKDLEPACVNGDSSYEDRKAARDKEIDALHQAQGILKEAFNEPAPAAFLAPVHRA